MTKKGKNSGSSLQAIKYIAANKVDSEKLSPFIKKYLKCCRLHGIGVDQGQGNLRVNLLSKITQIFYAIMFGTFAVRWDSDGRRLQISSLLTHLL
jgi:hypothetical protein